MRHIKTCEGKKKLITNLKFEIKDVVFAWSVNRYELKGGKKI